MIILITGGSSGLGEAITRTLAHNTGNTVYFTYNSSAEKAKQIETDLPNTVAIKCNFSVIAEVEALAGQIAEIKPDVLVNNAYTGSFMKAYFHKTPAEDFLTGFQQNIVPTMAITQAAINVFRKKKSGKVITVLTSALINVPPAGASIYVANKAYLQQMAKVWASENNKYGISSNTISPSFMLTTFTGDTDERIVEQMTENHPLKKLLTTTEVAETVLYLVGASAQVNGIDIAINAATSIK